MGSVSTAAIGAMKYVILLPDGASDVALAELGGSTPLEAARHPNMDWVARNGRLGQVVTIPDGYTAGTDVGTMSLLGYDPHRYYSGRAPLEAAAKGLAVRPDQMIFRCNFVTIAGGRMDDNTAHHVSQDDAEALCTALAPALAPLGCELHAGVTYRNLLLLGDAASFELETAPPHDIIGQGVADHQPRGAGAERVRAIMAAAAPVLRDHPVNARRRADGRPEVSDIWLWGQGRPSRFESFAERFGPRAAVITAVDILRGLAVLMGMRLIHVPGATGYLDTDYAGKGRAAVAALDETDMIVVHVEAADEAAHMGSAAEKVKALERIDQDVLGPLLDHARALPAWRLLIAADHATLTTTRGHAPGPPLFAYAGSGVAGAGRGPFTEAAARRGGDLVERGHELMPAFLGRPGAT